MGSNRDQLGQHPYGSVHKAARKGWDRLVRAGGVVCWRCGESIPRHARWDLGHVNEEGRRAGYPLRHPEHIGCNRATLTHAKQANGRPTTARATVKRDRFDGLPDPDPDNTVDRWSRHWGGPFNPRCPDCRRLGGPCEKAAADGR